MAQSPKESSPGTDWDEYYQTPYTGAEFTRRLMGRVLAKFVRKHVSDVHRGPLRIAELGGANSSFFRAIKEVAGPAEYHIFDSNRVGLDLTLKRLQGQEGLSLHCQDITELEWGPEFDLVFSVGLIEHFSVLGTQKAIEAHFKLAGPSGIVIITFPTPTLLYRVSRALSELLGLWIFHDERPLRMDEVEKTALQYGFTVDSMIVWPILFTQRIMVMRKT